MVGECEAYEGKHSLYVSTDGGAHNNYANTENPSVRIRIVGHTDSVGSNADNQMLSEGRAGAVKDDMVGRGIDASRIETEGKGESAPVADNATEEERAMNRRVEFVVL